MASSEIAVSELQIYIFRTLTDLHNIYKSCISDIIDLPRLLLAVKSNTAIELNNNTVQAILNQSLNAELYTRYLVLPTLSQAPEFHARLTRIPYLRYEYAYSAVLNLGCRNMNFAK
jgi:hypothetical protein